jgi:hypothetical protein
VQTILAGRDLGSRYLEKKAAWLMGTLDEAKSKAPAGIVRSAEGLAIDCSVNVAVMVRMNIAVGSSARGDVALMSTGGKGAGHGRSHGSRKDSNGGLHGD